MNSDPYDLIVLGAGPAGYMAAERAGGAGLRTVLIEKNHLGGVCLNEGCVPSKTLLNSSKLYHQVQHAQAFGVTATGASFDLATVMIRKNKIIETLRKGIGATLKKHRVFVEYGEGTILPKIGDLFAVKAGEKVITGERLLICTGSEAIRPQIPGAEQFFVLTNREILNITALPKNIVIIGGGAIGLEFADFFAATGSSVVLVELLSSLGGRIDAEISRLLQKELSDKGIVFHLSAMVTGIGDHTVTYEKDGMSQTVLADIVLLSTGRRPVIRGFGLESIGVKVDSNAIATDAHGRTNIPGVWAAGDVNGRSMLAHTAYREAEVCINDIIGTDDKMRYDAIPSVIYTHPEVAMVGMTLDVAKSQGIDAASSRIPLSYSGRYLAENENGRGICKVVFDKSNNSLLGVHMIGGPCSEMIFGAAVMIENKLRIEDVRKAVFPHPTVSEVIRDALWLL
ncbi:MAG: dihydrolipoyl dehydrogenase [Chitinispirillaceae bacterium]|jgi:dihydrolipoamide dehydrogenase|nr:dihydrolipoyl dehydrogenase [Chitinispirillaceae bacterium]